MIKKLNLIFAISFKKISMALQVHSSYEMLVHPEEEQHVFLRIANVIYQTMGVNELQTFRTKLKTFESDMLIITSKINRVKSCERNQTMFPLVENGIRKEISIVTARSLIVKELSNKLNHFTEYLNSTSWQVAAMTDETYEIKT